MEITLLLAIVVINLSTFGFIAYQIRLLIKSVDAVVNLEPQTVLLEAPVEAVVEPEPIEIEDMPEIAREQLDSMHTRPATGLFAEPFRPRGAGMRRGRGGRFEK